MTVVSHVRNPLSVALALFGVFLAMISTVSAPAFAQVQLFPKPAQEAPAVESSPDTAAPAAPSGFAVEELGGIDAEVVGALTAEEDALPADLWGNLSRSAIAALIDTLPSTSNLPSTRDLSRRLLMSAASLPPASDRQPVSVLQARINTLVRLGFAKDAGSLATVGASALSNASGRMTVANAQLAAFDLPAACGSAATETETQHDLFWQKLLAFCQAAAGQTDQASLAAQTLLDLGGEDDPLYFALMDTLTLGLAPEIDGLPASGPLHYAMLRLAKADPGENSEDPGIALLSAQGSEDLALVEEAVLRGLLAPAHLAEKYAAERFKASALETPLEVLDRVSAPSARALLFQAMQNWDIPALKAEAITVALERARADGVLIAVAPVVKDPALGIPPSSDLLWFAEDAARLFYLSGDIGAARVWHGLLREASSVDPTMAAADARLWHLAMLSGETGAALGRTKQGWADAIVANASETEDGVAYSQFLEALVEATTGATPLSGDAELRRAAMTGGPDIGPGAAALTLHMLDHAATDKRVGEVVALALAALSVAPAEDISRSTLVRATRALFQVGLLKEARRLAIEAAILTAPDSASQE